MTKYLITLIVFLIAAILFLYSRSKKQNQIRALKKDPRTGTFTDMKTGQKPLNEVIAQISSGTQLWRYFIWFALLMLLAEVLLIRFFKK